MKRGVLKGSWGTWQSVLSNFSKARYFHSLALASCIVLYLCLSLASKLL